MDDDNINQGEIDINGFSTIELFDIGGGGYISTSVFENDDLQDKWDDLIDKIPK